MRYVIIDLDNCISDDGWRIAMVRHDLPRDRRWDSYHSASFLDSARNHDIYSQQNTLNIICTARPRKYEELTMRWLKENRVPWEHLMMRSNGEHSPAVDVKRSMVRSLPSFGIEKADIAMAYDDKPDIVAMYRAEGLPAIRRYIHKFDAELDYTKGERA